MTVFDPGLQPERTELAWRRTALSLSVGSLVALRLLPVVLGNAAWALAGVAGLLAAGVLWLGSRRRYRAVVAALARDGDRAILPDSLLLATLATSVLLAGLAAVVVVITLAVA